MRVLDVSAKQLASARDVAIRHGRDNRPVLGAGRSPAIAPGTSHPQVALRLGGELLGQIDDHGRTRGRQQCAMKAAVRGKPCVMVANAIEGIATFTDIRHARGIKRGRP